MNHSWRIVVALCFPIFNYFVTAEANRCKVGLFVMATGKYLQFVEPLIGSARQYFLPNHDVHYYVFSDGVNEFVQGANDITLVYQERLNWPYDTLMRFQVYYGNRDVWADRDYVFASDADMLFVDTVGDEILGDLVGVQHPGFVGKRGTYDTNPRSTAYVAADEGEYYFAGGVYGGTRENILKFFETVIQRIQDDLSWRYIALWHDESHLNRYFIDNKPTVILSPSYCYPESWKLPYKKRLLALDKNHGEMRS